MPKTEPEQNIESGTTALPTRAESFCQKLEAPEPYANQALEAPQNDNQKLTNEAVSTTVVALELPVESEQTAHVQTPLSFWQKLNAGRVGFLAKTKTTDKIVADGSTNGSTEQVLKTAKALEQQQSLVFGANSLGVFGAKNTTFPESLPVTPLAETVVESAHLTAVETAV